MRRYRLTPDEKEIVDVFDKTSIPWIFYAGKYGGYFAWLEAVMVEICPMLRKGEIIDEHTYNILVHDDIDIADKVDVNDLQGVEREYYDNFLAVLEIAEKYYKLLRKQ